MTQEERVFRDKESAHSISDTQGEPETPGEHGATASSWIVSEVVENFAAGGSGSVDETNNYVENDATDKERTSVMKNDQRSVLLSDEDLRTKGLISFEEKSLLNKSDQVGNKDERAEQVSPHSSSGNLAQTIPLRNSMKLKLLKANKNKVKLKMKMIAGKEN